LFYCQDAYSDRERFIHRHFEFFVVPGPLESNEA
jgi:hypothetical protein